MDRRNALRLMAGAGVIGVAACSSAAKDNVAGSTSTSTAGAADTTSTVAATSGTTLASGSLSQIPGETAGPYPGDGSNGPQVLTEDGVVRSDIRSSFGSSSGYADGEELTIKMTVVDAATGLAMPGAAIYAWHCDAEGRYSLYSQGATGENYLRGVQAADGNGVVTFVTTFPGAYQGRWPHVHFEVFKDLATATSNGSRLATSQIALPEDICAAVYADSTYPNSSQNLSQTSLTSDMVFADSWEEELATMSGGIGNGLTASLLVPV